MNPPLYCVTYLAEDGSRRFFHTKKGRSIYTNLASAKKALAQLKRRRNSPRGALDVRIEEGTPNWKPIQES